MGFQQHPAVGDGFPTTKNLAIQRVFVGIFWRIRDLRPEVQQACGLHCPSAARLVGMNDQSSFKSLHQRTVGMKIRTSAFIF